MSDRDKAQSGEISGVGLVGALIVGGIAKAVSDSNKKKKMQQKQTQLQQIQAKKQEINNQIQRINSQITDIDRQINNYKNEFLGSWLNDTKIEELERKRSSLVKERSQYEQLLNK